MNSNDRISMFYQEYKADISAARIAEQKGNFEGARKLYRQAALALCEMANMESGETRKQRVAHAEQIMAMAEQLGRRTFVPAINGSDAGSGNARNGRGGDIPVSGTGDKEEENMWKSEGIPDTTFDDVVGMEDVKKLIRTRVIDQIKYPELYEEYDLKGGTGVLLFGLPGTGKTTIARAIAHEINAPLYTVQSSDVLSKWVGESEKRIRQLFDAARATPTALIFFDDFDALGAERREDANSAHSNKVIVELINQMDGFRKNTNTIVLLAATNKPWIIDSALMRPGRFEHHFYVPLANHEARKMLVAKNLGNVPVESDLDLDKISDLLKGYNGADIVSVVKGAKIAGLQRSKEQIDRGEEGTSPITFEDFRNAAETHHTSVDPDDIIKLRQYAEGRGIKLPDEL